MGQISLKVATRSLEQFTIKTRTELSQIHAPVTHQRSQRANFMQRVIRSEYGQFKRVILIWVTEEQFVS